MGLLTNPNANSEGGLMSLLERHHLRLAWFCYFIGVAGIFVFPGREWDSVIVNCYNSSDLIPLFTST